MFHACVHKKSGAVRLVEAAKPCRRKTRKRPGEFRVSWNQRGPAGLDGTNGTNGTNGAAGPAGRDGTTIVARARGTTEITTTGDAQLVPVTGGNWTQAATELNQFVGEVTYDPPSMADCGNAGPLGVSVLVNGSPIGFISASPGPQDNVTRQWTFDSLFEPGADSARVLTVSASDGCSGPGHFKIKSVKIDVISLR